MDREFLRSCLRRGMSVRAIGKAAGKSPSTVSYHLRKHGLTPAKAARQANRGALDPAVLRDFTEDGASIRAIAEQVDRSPSTVRYWLDRYGIDFHRVAGNRRSAEEGLRNGEATVRLDCRRHGSTDFHVAHNGDYHCKLCRKERVAKWRRQTKKKLVSERGGACALCGYSRCISALQFHHLDPAEKSFGLARRGHIRAYSELAREADKCVLLCANCHAEVEAGLVTVSRSGDGKLSVSDSG